MTKPDLKVINGNRHASTRLRDVVRDTEQRIAEGGEANRPQSTMADYSDIKAAYDIAEQLVEAMDDHGCLHVVAESHIGKRLRGLVRGEERK